MAAFSPLFMLFIVFVSARPVVLLHGLLARSEAMDHARSWISADFPKKYVKNVELFPNATSDRDSLFVDLWKQLFTLAETLRKDGNLSGGFDAIGHSQGALLLRAYIQVYAGRNGYPKVCLLVYFCVFFFFF